MLARTLPPIMIAVAAIYLSDGAFAVGAGRPHTPSWSRSANVVGWKQKAARTRALASNPYADPAAPYKSQPFIVVAPANHQHPQPDDRHHKAGYGRQERHDRQGCVAHDSGRHGRTIILARKYHYACAILA
jgi:hypothetical protein